MQKKIFISYVVVILLAIGITAGIFWSKGHQHLNRQNDAYYLSQAELMADIFETDSMSLSFEEKKEQLQIFVQEYGKKYNIRVTLIEQNGEVAADSDTTEELSNHKTRIEVSKALQGESAASSRYSKTMKQMYSYSAVPVNRDGFQGVLRISIPLENLKILDQDILQSLIWSVILGAILAIAVAIVMSRVIAKPLKEMTLAADKIAKGDYKSKIYSSDKGEIGMLADSFNTMTTNLRVNMKTLTSRNTELEAILASMGSAVVAIDTSNAIIFSNPAFLSLIEHKNNDITGRSLYSMVRNRVIYEVIDAVREGDDSSFIWEREGNFEIHTPKVIRVTATALRDTKKVMGILMIIEDVTNVKKLENIRKDFVSNVTHELKTPLTSIRGFIETLKNGAIHDEKVVNKFLTIIDIEAERLYHLIQDILLLSEIESKADLECEECSVDDLVQDVIDLLSKKAAENVTIQYERDQNVKQYFCNPDRIKQLFINLLDNAIKCTEEGTIMLTCKEEDGYLILKISDTGIGIGEAYLDRIFERFYRVDKGRSRKQGGTGLGLSIVKHIVELYNGTVQVESEPLKGTTFTVSLPYDWNLH